jgi:hypothetical protein
LGSGIISNYRGFKIAWFSVSDGSLWLYVAKEKVRKANSLPHKLESDTTNILI